MILNINLTYFRIKRQDTSVCYPDLGCFESSGPFGYLDMLPSTPEEINTKFLLYPLSSNRRRSGSQPTEVPFGNITDAFEWAKKGFNSSLPTKIMIHGFGSDCSHIWVYEMRSALLTVEDVNVICVDWANGAILPNYVKASANTRLVGKQLSIFLKGLIDNIRLSVRKMHLIGFSLGAHVAGFAGAELGNLSRITGLDPAGPLFESQDPRARLDQSDADFVDVIHSNGENLILGGLGSWQPMGHVDFYPNGGRMQKGCTNLFVGAVSDIIWSTAVEGRSLCNHRRAYKFFTDSIHPRCHFPAFPCETYDDFLAGQCFPCTDDRKCGNMGYYADRAKGRGQLYLITRDEEPFCAHQYVIKIESSSTEVPIVSYGRIQVTLIGDSLLNETFTLTKKEDEEMRLGDSISRIVVPHPILLPPSNIQLLYTSYNGWLTSGLQQWKIDKIVLSDSYGKSVSICRKNLVLDSGIPVILPLYPGDCNPPRGEKDKISDTRPDDINVSKFVPNIKEDEKNNTIPLGDIILNIPWTNEEENVVDSESESSRAFNTRYPKPTFNPEVNKINRDDISGNKNESETVREVVEPILKPHSSKNARAHNLNKEKSEITEPILAATTSKYGATKTSNNVVDELKSVERTQDEVRYDIYDADKDNDWVPSVVGGSTTKPSEKYKREDDSKSGSHSRPSENFLANGFDTVVRTVQFLPQRIARMFEDAEKYARETILPFVSTYTPRFITDFINPRDRERQQSTPAPRHRYVPLNFEEPKSTTVKTTTPTTTTTTTVKTTPKLTTSTTIKKATSKTTTSKPIIPIKSEDSNKISLKQTTTHKPAKITGTPWTTSTSISKIKLKNSKIETTTPYTHIQKIHKKGEKVSIVYPANTENLWNSFETLVKQDQKSAESTDSQRSINTKRSSAKEIYIDLPVFDNDYTAVKYIPLSNEEAKK
ncbi:lipase [Holotrichia oblita]|uniref:Lipase n=1 Tax=Holotrichia oblita TaxID=644536 RepID=A0ACB9T5X0_HOLOL|nr:lipase [Holotrichia oblita]